MKRFMLIAAGTAALFAVAPAQAVTIPVGSPQFTATPGADGAFFGSFSLNGIAAGNFSDAFTFTLPSSGLGSGSVTSIATGLLNATDLDFTSVTINGQAATLSGAGELVESAAAKSVPISMGVLNTIIVNGVSRGAGSFAGTLSFVPFASAAPEPASWALMILGFGLAGVGLRARRRASDLAFA